MNNKCIQKYSAYVYAWLIVIFAIASFGCKRSDTTEVNLSKTEPVSAYNRETPGLRIGMGAMITPKEGYTYYVRLKDYLAKDLSMPVVLVDRENYNEMNKMIADGGVDIAFVCAGPYVKGHDQLGLKLLAMPLVNGKPEYRSYIIVPKDSPAKSLDDLKGKKFAFTDPLSHSGKQVPTYLLARRKEKPETFFSSVVYTYGHDRSITAVAEMLVDGAAVDSLIWEYMNRSKPSLTARTRIIDISEPYGIPPIVSRHDLSPELKKRVLSSLLNMHKTTEGKAILAGMMIDQFVPGKDSNYNSIRAMDKLFSKKVVK